MRRALSVVTVVTAVAMCNLWAGNLVAAEAGADPAAAPTAAVHLWASDIFSHARPDAPAAEMGKVSIVGARGGAFSGRVMAASSAAIKGLRATASELKGEGGAIAAKDVWVRYAVPFEKDRLDVLLESPPATVAAGKRGAMTAVWVTVSVPGGAAAGTYKGTVTVEADGLAATAVPVELRVADWTLPATTDYTTWVGMIQSPDSLSIEYKTPLWSDEHWRLIAQSFGHMKALGCRNIYIPLLARTNYGNAESMVRWVKKDDGTYGWDFTIMDRYLDLAQKHLGKVTMVTFQAWEVYLAEKSDKSLSFRNRDAAREGREELKGMGPRVTVLDPKTGATEMVYLPRFEEPESKALWAPLFAELHKRMKARELEDTMMLGVVSDVWPSKEEVAFLNEVSGGLAWVSQSHPGRIKNKPQVGNKSLLGIADIGYEAHVYSLNFQVNPDKGRQYGWQRPQFVVRFARNGWPNYSSDLQLHLLPAFNITGGQRGIGRLGAEFWPVVRNRRGERSAMVYQQYPEVCWRNLDIDSWVLAPGPEGPVSTARLENLREGLQECEARIAIERALVDPELKAMLGDELATECQKLLDERHRAMWRSIWSDQADLDGLGNISDREPIEALWGALNKAGKKLPGYWDGEARKRRSDEDAQGTVWFAASGWQARNEKLFTMANKVQSITKTKTAKVGE